jgi:hypothetical protein
MEGTRSHNLTGVVYTPWSGGPAMALPKGMTATSSMITISSTVDESAANTFTTVDVDLTLNALDQEAFIVYAVQSDLDPCDAIPGANTATGFSLSTTQRTTLGNLSDNNVFHVHNMNIRAAGFVDSGVGFDQVGPDSASGDLPYIAVIATNNFSAQILGQANAAAKSADFKVYGQRVRLSAAQYAALVQSELLSL